MQSRAIRRGGWGWLSALLLAAVVFSGCAANRVDWNSRVGAYTFDQAVTDYGPPDKEAKLTDGTRVAEWLMNRGFSHGSFATFNGPFITQYTESRSPDFYLRLTFDPSGKLTGWKQVAK